MKQASKRKERTGGRRKQEEGESRRKRKGKVWKGREVRGEVLGTSEES